MRREYFIFLSAVFLAVVGLSGSSAQQPADNGFRNSVSITQLEAFTDGIVADRLDDLDPAAMMVSVVRGDEGFAKAYGLADAEKGRRADETTLFRIGSISKTFIWLSVMMLAEGGKIDLNADVNDYLKTFKVPEAFDRPITMNDLMTHRAGFEDSYQVFYDPRRDVTIAEALKRSIPKRVAAPGERTAYSNWGSSLAALIVQNIAGEPYDKFVRRRILGPLGMTSTTLHDPASISGKQLNPKALDARMAIPYKPEGGGLKKRPYMAIEPEYAIGAMALDARDAAKYMRMLLGGTRYDGGQLLKDESWAIFRQRLFDDRSGGDDVNHGFMEADVGGMQAFGHGGGTQFLSTMFVIPESEIGIFASSSSNNPKASPSALVRMIALYSQGKYADFLPFVKTGDRKLSQELAGTYRSNRSSFSKAEKIFSFGSDLLISVAEDGAAVATASGQQLRYVAVGNDLWMSATGSRFKAYRDKSGKIFRISGGAGTQTLDRIGYLETTSAINHALGVAIFLSITTLLGVWWRWERAVKTTAAGRKLSYIPVTVAIIWSLLGMCQIWVSSALGTMGLDELQGPGKYPPMALSVTLWVAIIAAVAAVVQIVAVIPVWFKSGWSVWRRIHFTFYATALGFAVIVMWNWNLIGKPLSDVG